MKITSITALAALAIMSGACVAEAAQCQTRLLTGMWVGQERNDDEYCIVQFRRSGWVVQASCFNEDTLISTGTWNGRFTTTRDCSVSGNFDFIPTRGRKINIVFNGTMNPRRGIMTGTMSSRGGERVRFRFVQQWN